VPGDRQVFYEFEFDWTAMKARIPGFTQPFIQDPQGVFFPARRRWIRGVSRGVSRRYKQDAELDYKKYSGNERLYRELLARLSSEFELILPKRILEVGAGAGSLTFPLLEASDSTVYATDISANQLWILNRQAISRGLDSRLVPIQIDNRTKYLNNNEFDLIIGAAIAHHVVDPIAFIELLGHALRPSGRIVLFEPIASGQLIIRDALIEIDQEVGSFLPIEVRRFFSDLVLDIEARTPSLSRLSNWQKNRLDDKSFVDLELTRIKFPSWGIKVMPVLDPKPGEAGVASQHVANMLRSYLLWDEANSLPPKVWEILRDYDQKFESRSSAPVIEGAVILQKPA
jgi:2-polyprenyl-3-methyl-5-hydroxy-6-metoxy-1,4-benzoquinol methylase